MREKRKERERERERVSERERIWQIDRKVRHGVP